MRKKDMLLLIALLMLASISVASLFYRSIVLEDFEIMENEKDGFEIPDVGSDD